MKWEIHKHATPDYAPQYGVCEEGAQNDFYIVRGDNAKANATLIAAALDLLDALEGIMEYEELLKLQVCRTLTNELSKARAAIARAKGES